MAIVQAGKPFTADELQLTAGNLAAMLRDHATDGMQLKAQLETWPDADLIELGLTQPEINAIKGFFIGDLPAIYNLLVASSWIKQLLGTGV
jgi:hypothetical protein